MFHYETYKNTPDGPGQVILMQVVIRPHCLSQYGWIDIDCGVIRQYECHGKDE